MKASLDTNVIIHLYRASQEEILFSCFKDGVYIYEQIRKVELAHHGQDILDKVDRDIQNDRLIVITNEELKKQGVYTLFQGHVNENIQLYSPQDRGEVFAISLAQTLGAYCLITDDIKQGGPYMSLLQFLDNDIMPFTYFDVLMINYLAGNMETNEMMDRFYKINSASMLNWNIKSHLRRFIKRFWSEPYQESERMWMRGFCKNKHINAKEKLIELSRKIQ